MVFKNFFPKNDFRTLLGHVGWERQHTQRHRAARVLLLLFSASGRQGPLSSPRQSKVLPVPPVQEAEAAPRRSAVEEST